jgi:large subunit ribosomal protein L10
MKDEAKKVSANRQKKAAIVAEVNDKAKKATAVVFTNYQGMTHLQLESLRKALKAVNAELAITKNTLLKIALADSGFGEAAKDQVFEQPTAAIYAYGDVVAPLKEIAKSVKTLKLPLIKFGIYEGKVLSEAQVNTLSTLPPKEVLIAQFVGTLKSPLFGLHRALNWNMQKLVLTLKAVEKSKGGATN